MYASKLPEPWIIAEVERQRRNRESMRDERPALELPLPPPRDPSPEPGRTPGSTVIVIDLW